MQKENKHRDTVVVNSLMKPQKTLEYVLPKAEKLTRNTYERAIADSCDSINEDISMYLIDGLEYEILDSHYILLHNGVTNPTHLYQCGEVEEHLIRANISKLGEG
jgi:hypothetical protein